jgi:hypothetical protein
MEMNMEKLTLEQVRAQLVEYEELYTAAMDFEHYGMADGFLGMIEALQIELIGRITSADPYTTAADVRQFEGFRA